jgi:hypothetical protein
MLFRVRMNGVAWKKYCAMIPKTLDYWKLQGYHLAPNQQLARAGSLRAEEDFRGGCKIVLQPRGTESGWIFRAYVSGS